MGSNKVFENLVYYLATLHRKEENFERVKKFLQENPEMIFWKLKYPFCVRCRKSIYRSDAEVCRHCNDKLEGQSLS